jgi:hypothetical protein
MGRRSIVDLSYVQTTGVEPGGMILVITVTEWPGTDESSITRRTIVLFWSANYSGGDGS